MISSVRGFFGFSGAKTTEEDKKEIREIQEKLDKEFYEKFEIEEEKLNQEIDDFIFKNKSIFDPDLIDEMPPEWVRFDLSLKIPEIKFLLLTKEYNSQ